MKVVFIRHAEPIYSRDILTAKGEREAELLSERLCNVDAKKIYVSPLGRAKATAAVTIRKMREKTGKCPDCQVLQWLQEFRGRIPDKSGNGMRLCWDLPSDEWKNRPKLYSPAEWIDDEKMQGGNVKTIWQETVDGMESILNENGYFRKSHTAVWKCDNNTTDIIFIFCHFGIMAASAAYILGVSPVVMWQCFSCQPSGVTTIITEERTSGEVSFRCVGFGDLTHLYSANEPCSLAGLFQEKYDGTDSTWPYNGDNVRKGFVI